MVSYLATLAEEVHQLGMLLRASGEEIAQASREVGLSPAEHIGPPAVDTAAEELVGRASANLGRVALAIGDVEQLLHRLAAGTADSASEQRGPMR
jgi:hypothetical protein